MAGDHPSPAIPHGADRSTPSTLVRVERSINGLLRDKTLLADQLLGEKLKRENMNKSFLKSEADFQRRIGELEALIHRLKLENEKFRSDNGGLEAQVEELKTDLNTSNEVLIKARLEYYQSHGALQDSYEQLKITSTKTKQDMQKAWAEHKKLQEENDLLIGNDRRHFLERRELNHLIDILRDELRWYKKQEAIQVETDKRNAAYLNKLNEEILSSLHVYGQLDEEKARNQCLQEENGRLQYELEKLQLDVKVNERLREMGVNSSIFLCT